MATQCREANTTCALSSSEFDEFDEERSAMLFAESLVQGWISRIKEDGADGLKEVPPLVILHFPDLIKDAWYLERLVPWRAGWIKWDKYLEYIRDFFEKHCVHPILHSASDRCLKMEAKYLTSPAVKWGEASLSKAIMERSNYMKQINDMSLSEGESAVAAAGFMCIAEEALLMSELTESEDYQIIFSDDVRQHALNLMGYKGSQYTVVCAALLGMMKEAELLCKYLCGDGPNHHEEISTCCIVRQRTLELFTILEKLFAEEISYDNPIEGTPTDKLTGEILVAPEDDPPNEKEDLVNSKLKLPQETDTKNLDGENNIKKKTNRIGKTKAYIQSLLKRSMKQKLFSSRKS